ncbi:MAG: LysR substrate-binding domain-containing protein [Pseudomonadota bacterium]
MKIPHSSMPNSEHLRTFQVVAEMGNVTEAAATLGRTQSAISLQIRKLESTLGVRLFERQARGVRLTEDGRRLLPVTGKVLDGIEQIAAMFANPLTGRVRIGLPDDFCETILESALARFASRHRHVEVTARSGCTAGFPDAIKRNELDIAVYSAGPIDPEQAFYSEPTVWAAGVNFQPDNVHPVPLALFDRACWWRDVPVKALDNANRPWRLAYSSENFVSVKAAISAGLAIGVLAESALEPSMKKLSGFPPLPPTSLVLLKNEKAAPALVLEMERAIRTAIGGV